MSSSIINGLDLLNSLSTKSGEGLCALAGLLVVLTAPPTAVANDYPMTDLILYNDALGPGWQDWSWGSVNLTASSPVYSGTYAIAVDLGPHQGLSFWHQPFDAQSHGRLEFYVHGGTAGGQQLNVFLHDDEGSELPAVSLNDPAYLAGGTVDAGTWKLVSIPLTDLGMAPGQNTFTRVNLVEAAGATPPTTAPTPFVRQ